MLDKDGLKLNEKGNRVIVDTICYFQNKVRYRDIARRPKIYLVVDSTAASSNPAKENPEKICNPGVILEFIYPDPGGHEMEDKRK